LIKRVLASCWLFSDVPPGHLCPDQKIDHIKEEMLYWCTLFFIFS